MVDGADLGSKSQVEMTTVSPILLPPFPSEGGMGAQSVRTIAWDLWAPCSQSLQPPRLHDASHSSSPGGLRTCVGCAFKQINIHQPPERAGGNELPKAGGWGWEASEGFSGNCRAFTVMQNWW